MKRIVSLLLALLLGLFCLAGCESSGEEPFFSTEMTKATTDDGQDPPCITNSPDVFSFFSYEKDTIFAKAKFKRFLKVQVIDSLNYMIINLEFEVLEDFYQNISAGELIEVTMLATTEEGSMLLLREAYQTAIDAKLEAGIPVDSEDFLVDNPLCNFLKKDAEYIFYAGLQDRLDPPYYGQTWWVRYDQLYPIQAGKIDTRDYNDLYQLGNDMSFSRMVCYQYYVKDTYPPQYEDPILTQDMPVAEAEENLRELYQRWKNGTVYEFVPSDYIITK